MSTSRVYIIENSLENVDFIDQHFLKSSEGCLKSRLLNYLSDSFKFYLQIERYALPALIVVNSSGSVLSTFPLFNKIKEKQLAYYLLTDQKVHVKKHPDGIREYNQNLGKVTTDINGFLYVENHFFNPEIDYLCFFDDLVEAKKLTLSIISRIAKATEIDL